VECVTQDRDQVGRDGLGHPQAEASLVRLLARYLLHGPGMLSLELGNKSLDLGNVDLRTPCLRPPWSLGIVPLGHAWTVGQEPDSLQPLEGIWRARGRYGPPDTRVVRTFALVGASPPGRT
jgi:hypothetical protein